MRAVLISTILSSFLAPGPATAAPSVPPPSFSRAPVAAPGVAQVWAAKSDKAPKGKAKGHKAKKHSPASKKAKKHRRHTSKGKGNDHAAKKNRQNKGGAPAFAGNGNGPAKALPDRALRFEAPANRDMVDIVNTAALIWAKPDAVISDQIGRKQLRYLNCPPGLAKKSPPCVPPGLAKEGVGTEEWLSYSPADYERLWAERVDRFEPEDQWTGSQPWPLNSDQIATLYGLDPAPAGQRYALIDGLPVLLDNDAYGALRRINDLARTDLVAPGTMIAPTAALTQAELQSLYRLPPPGDGENYAVLNGQLITISDESYDMLQLLRIARAAL